MRDEKFNEPQFEYPPNERQQEKIINLVTIGKITERVKPARREKFISDVANGTITSEKILDNISSITRPDPIEAWQQIKKYKKVEQVQGLVLDALDIEYTPENYAKRRKNIKEPHLIMLQEKYEDPWTLRKRLKPLFDEIEEANGVAKREQYEEAAHELLDAVYGKRYEYFVQARYLWEEAKKHRSKNKSEQKPPVQEKRSAKEEQETRQTLLELSPEFGNIKEENASRARKLIRTNGKGQMPFTISKGDGTCDVYTVDHSLIPENIDGPESQEALARLALEISELVLETNKNLDTPNKKKIAFYNAVAPDFNDAADLSFENNTSREHKVRSNILRIFNENT